MYVYKLVQDRLADAFDGVPLNEDLCSSFAITLQVFIDTIDREIFVVKIFSSTTFSEKN